MSRLSIDRAMEGFGSLAVIGESLPCPALKVQEFTALVSRRACGSYK